MQVLIIVLAYTTMYNDIGLMYRFSFFGLLCLTSISRIFQLYRGGQFYWWRKPEYPEKATDLSYITDKLYRIILYRLSGIRTHNIGGEMH